MRIKSIEIKNYRSYVGHNRFAINPRLTLIIGANGEGKTNLYDAMEWLFDNNLRSDSRRFVSKKAIVSLNPGETGDVLVAIDFEHNETNYRIEKSFSFIKSDDDTDFRVTPVHFCGYIEEGSERVETNGANLLDRCFNASIRHFSLMAGEESLKVLNQHETLQYLIHTFSAVRNAEKYIDFFEYATSMSQRASANAISKNTKNKNKSDELSRDIKDLEAEINRKQAHLRNKQRESQNYSTQIEAIVNSSEASEEMKNLETRLTKLKADLEVCKNRTRDNYTIGLLDDMYVLGGILPILNEFSDKVAEADRARRKVQKEFDENVGARNALNRVKLDLANGATPISILTPDVNVLREMLNDHICKVCGTPAPEGSAAYKYIENKLNAYLESVTSKQDEEAESCFSYSFIPQLYKLETIINNDRGEVAKIYQRLLELIEFNEARKKQAKKITDNIAQVEEAQRKLQAKVPGVTKEQLLNNFENLTNWNKLKSNYDRQIVDLQHQIENLEEKLSKKRTELNNLGENTPAAVYTRIAQAFVAIREAFKGALVRNKTDFIIELENVSNKYLARLNVEDFKGSIHISTDVSGALRIQLIDLDKSPIDPNKALETTMYMSVLFAISELTEIKKDDEYPLLFDAPTSSFTAGKERDFFKIIDNLDKQIIVVTKCFLHETSPNHYVLDTDLIDRMDLKGTIYRIEKMRPFDDKNQATIQTVITKIR